MSGDATAATRRRAERERRRRQRAGAGEDSVRPAVENDRAVSSASPSKPSSIGDLAADLLKRAASPTLLGAAAGAATAARLAAKPKGETADHADTHEQSRPRRAGARGRTKEEPEPPGLDDAAGADAVGERPSESLGRRDGERLLLDGIDRAEEPLRGLSSWAPKQAELEDAEDDEPTPALLRSDHGETVRQALQYARELTGREVDGISAIEKDGQGLRVTVEVVELKRIPSSTDVLASYELLLDDDGALVEYRRARRYYRNATTEERFA